MARVRRQPPDPARPFLAPAGAVPVPLTSARRNVLYAVRRRGQASAEDVAEQLGMTVSGARQHLSALLEQRLVDATDVPPTARGRPSIVYGVTDLGDAMFPKAYGELTVELLGYLADEEPDVIDRLFARRRDARVANARRRLDSLGSLRARAEELTRILDEDGYLATSEPMPDGGFRIIEQNCAIWSVAARYGQCCSSELEFIRAVLPGTEVRRVQHRIEGAAHCAYEVRPAGG